MKENEKKSIVENIIIYLVLPLLVVPLVLCLYYENEIDQLGKAFIYGPKYTFLPFFLIFIVILYSVKTSFKDVLIRSIQFSMLYALCSICPVLLINNNLGEHHDYTISGIVVDTKPGKGKSKPSVTVKNNYEEITFRLDRKIWKSIFVGKEVSLKVKKGSLGLIYK